jgi:cytochrome c biogenesis protein CcmG/thiol:disulfide interchange protein DsbE
LRPAILVTTLFAALIAAGVGVAAQPPTVTTPRWPVLDAYAGKVVLVDFWASWCSPCLRSFPWMNELQQDHGEEGLVVLAVNLDQDRQLADAFLGKTPAKFRVEYDPAGTVARQFDVQAMPTSFLIDRRGKIRVRHAGFKDKHRAEREQQIAQLLKEPGP